MKREIICGGTYAFRVSEYIFYEVEILAKPHKWTGTGCQIRSMFQHRALVQPEGSFPKASSKSRAFQDARGETVRHRRLPWGECQFLKWEAGTFVTGNEQARMS